MHTSMSEQFFDSCGALLLLFRWGSWLLICSTKARLHMYAYAICLFALHKPQGPERQEGTKKATWPFATHYFHHACGNSNPQNGVLCASCYSWKFHLASMQRPHSDICCVEYIFFFKLHFHSSDSISISSVNKMVHSCSFCTIVTTCFWSFWNCLFWLVIQTPSLVQGYAFAWNSEWL